jgi:hypothetical protein
MYIGYWWEIQKRIDHWEEQDVGGCTVVKFILERSDAVLWTGLIWPRVGTNGVLL